jgi:hypothetical protein
MLISYFPSFFLYFFFFFFFFFFFWRDKNSVELARATQFDHTRMRMLGVAERDIPTCLRDALADLKARGLLPN